MLTESAATKTRALLSQDLYYTHCISRDQPHAARHGRADGHASLVRDCSDGPDGADSGASPQACEQDAA